MGEETPEEQAMRAAIEEAEAAAEQVVSYEFVPIENLTEKQDAVIRQLADEMGFKNISGLAGYLASHDYTYYDAIRAYYEE